MYEVTVEGTFCATHRLRLPNGSLEPLHGHDWTVRATFTAEALSDVGTVVDFTAVGERLRGLLAHLHHRHLNDVDWLAGVNPTAEHVARVIFEQLSRGDRTTGRLQRVRVGEAPGCWATYGLP